MKLFAKNYIALPDVKSLQRICKAISVLDAIISPDWESRYYAYNCKWGKDEEFFEMRNGQGDHLHILFRKEGCVINGFAHEYEQHDKAKLTLGLPNHFHEFIFGEPVASIGTTFCIWTNKEGKWQIGEAGKKDDGSEDLLFIFDGKPETYVEWASEYFEESYSKDGISIEVAKLLYEGKILTDEMVLQVVDELEDWDQLEEDLNEIGYSYKFKT